MSERSYFRRTTHLASLFATLLFAPLLFAAEPEYQLAVTPPDKGPVCAEKNSAVADYFHLIRKTQRDEPELVEALRRFPKGADLHNHLSGSVMPEDYLALAAAEGDCYGPDSAFPGMLTITSPQASGACQEGGKPLKGADPAVTLQLVRSLSMYQFDYQNIQKGHDQFFATFARFNAVSGSGCNTGELLSRLARQAHLDNVSYVETMASFQSQAVGTLAKLLRQKYPDGALYGKSENYPALFDFLVSAGLSDAVSGAGSDILSYLAGKNTALSCASAKKDPACDVGLAFLATVNRNPSQKDGTPDLAKLFTQVAFSMALAAAESRVVGVNLVSGEDAPVSMGTFDAQMRIFSFFHEKFPQVNIALHAGEITPCFVGTGNAALKEHLTASLKAGAKRIGHGVSFGYLTDRDQGEVAQLFAKNGALVEINFTSNAQILGVAGAEHPFEAYRRHGVPLALSTDDEGVSHADFTSEWVYGVKQYGLKGEELKRLARESLQHSFIKGEPLWSDLSAGKVAPQCAGVAPGLPEPPEPCLSFLQGSAKALAQWRYEERLSHYLKWMNKSGRKLFETGAGKK